MRKIRYLFVAILQLLVVCLPWLVVMVERLLTYLLGALYVSMSSPRSMKILQRVVESRANETRQGEVHEGDTTETDRAIKDVLYVLDKRNNRLLNIDRETFEDTATGRKIVAQHPDRHLYSVLRPTRSENMRRIENALRAMTPYDLKHVHRCASKHMQFYV